MSELYEPSRYVDAPPHEVIRNAQDVAYGRRALLETMPNHMDRLKLFQADPHFQEVVRGWYDERREIVIAGLGRVASPPFGLRPKLFWADQKWGKLASLHELEDHLLAEGYELLGYTARAKKQRNS